MSGSAEATEDPSDSGVDFGGWSPTGRKTVAPDSELIEVENPDGHKQTAIVYDKTWREHDLLTTNVELVQSFMEFPMVEGIACLTRAPLGQGLFQYETGSVLALIEVLRGYRDQRKVVGIKAAVELLKSVTAMLQEASENGPMQGIYSHGGITPWRILLDADGNVQLVGYGLPQMDMVALREDPSLKVRDDSYKYCPPERLTSGFEDITTDLFSLVLIAYEMATGEPLLTGRAKALKKAVEMGEAQAKLITNPGGLPSPIHGAFVHALAFDPIGRFQEPNEFLAALLEAEGQVKLKGESLAEVMAQVRKSTRRGKALMDVGTAGGPRRALLDADRATRMKSATAARPVRGRAAAKKEETVKDGGRWGKVARSGQAEESEDDTPSRSIAGRPSRRRRGVADSASTSASRPVRRRTGGSADEDEAPSRRTRLRSSRSTDGDEEKPARARPSRLRSSRAADEEEAAPKPTRSRRSRTSSDAKAEEAEPKTRSRRTRSTTKEETTEAEAPAAAKPTRSRRTRGAAAEEPEDKAPASRKKRSAKSDDDKSAEADKPAKKAEEPKAEEPAAKPTRSRRTRAAKDEDEASEAPATKKPTRSRRSRAAKDDDEPKAEAKEATAKPTRSRRSRTTKDDDEPKAEAKEAAKKPTRSRRTRAAKDDDEPKTKKPTRSRRSRTKSED